MNKKSTKAALGLLLILGLMQFSPVLAEGNSLTQLDIQKGQGDSAVEVTLYTTNPYGENVAVTKKSNNKYVILMPNLSGSSNTTPNLSGLSDVISDVDVKSVNDGGHGYTKVTLTTTKPINVKTKMQKSMPITPEQKAYRELIAKSRAKTTLPSYVQDTTPNKTTEVKPKQQQQTTTEKTKKAELKKQTETTEKKAVDKKSEIKPVSSKSETTKNKNTDINKENTKRVQPQKETAPISTQAETSAALTPVSPETVSSTTPETALAPVQPTDTESVATTAATQNKQNIPFTIAMMLIPIAGLLLLVKLIRNSFTATGALRKSFIDNLADKPSEFNDYRQMAQDDNIGWQQKYRQYVSVQNNEPAFRTQEPVTVETNDYSFVSRTTDNIGDVMTQIQRPPKKLAKPNNIGQSNVVRMNPKTSALPIEIIEPIEIVEPPVPNPAPRSRKEKIAKGKKTKEVKKFNDTKKAQDSLKNAKKTKKVSVKKVVDAEVNKAVQALEQRINKLEAEKELQAKELKVVQAAKNDFEKLAEKKKQEAKNMENKKTNDEEYLVSLEQLLHNSPNAEKTNLNEDLILKELEQNFRDITVHKEEDSIANNMINSISSIPKMKKFKAFEDKVALEETFRNKPLPKKRSEVTTSVAPESRHVNLGYSKLHSSARVLEGGNLSVGDLLAKSGKFLNKPMSTPPVQPKLEPKTNNYSMATLEEFFAMDEKPAHQATAPEHLSDRVAQSLAQVKPSMQMKQNIPAQGNTSNPIAQSKTEKENYLSGLIVKSGFNIDKNKGFYIVNLDGETALIGRIKEEIFVLKKFATNIEKPIQVRQDNPNVYMVKADSFRSLVEVSDNKMGVLIEL